jgi:hypothetical protein
MLAIFLFIIVFTLFCNLTHRSKSEYRQHMRSYMTYNPARFTPKHKTSKRLNTSIVNYYA